MKSKVCKITIASAMCLGLMTPVSVFAAGPTDKTDVKINNLNFPDERFRTYLETYEEADDGIFSQEELDAITMMDCSNKNIKNLKGIEHFTSLKALDCSQNKLTRLYLNKNTQLEALDCSNNNLMNVNMKVLPKLKVLNVERTNLRNLNVSKNVNLLFLRCDKNNLPNIDVSNNRDLMFLSCGSNKIKKLDVTKNKNLLTLTCEKNLLKTIDVTKNKKLAVLATQDNYLDTLDISQNRKLITIEPGIYHREMTIYIPDDGIQITNFLSNGRKLAVPNIENLEGGVINEEDYFTFNRGEDTATFDYDQFTTLKRHNIVDPDIIDPVDPEKPGTDEDTDKPVDPEKPGTDEDTDKPVDPEKPGTDEDTDKPVTPEKPGTDEDTDKPVTPEKPDADKDADANKPGTDTTDKTDKEDKNEIPQTGDSTNMALLSVLLGSSAAAAVLLKKYKLANK